MRTLCTLYDCIETRVELCKRKDVKKRRVKWRKLFRKFYTWGNSRRRRRLISRLTSPISLVERRQRNEQFFFPRPINIFATILLLRSPSPPARLSAPRPFLSPFLSSFFPPYCDMSNPVETMRNDRRQVSCSEYTNVSILDDENASFSVHSPETTVEKLRSMRKRSGLHIDCKKLN